MAFFLLQKINISQLCLLKTLEVRQPRRSKQEEYLNYTIKIPLLKGIRAPSGKWLISFVQQEMFKINLKYLIVTESKETIKD